MQEMVAVAVPSLEPLRPMGQAHRGVLKFANLEKFDGYDRRCGQLRDLQPEFPLQSLSEPPQCAENFTKSTAGEFSSVYP